MAILTASNLAKSYRGRAVVQDVSLEISSGQIVGLLGPNGAGKTTCFYMIVGIVRADRGLIAIDGQDLTSLPMHGRARRGIGYLPQEASIFRRLSVADNIMAILESRADLNRAQRRDKMEQLLSLAFGDDQSDTTQFPSINTGGTGLAPGGSSEPTAPAAGYIDYLDQSGNLLCPCVGTTAPADWFYRRVWAVTSVSATLKEVAVTVETASAFGKGLLPRSTVVALKSSPF